MGLSVGDPQPAERVQPYVGIEHAHSAYITMLDRHYWVQPCMSIVVAHQKRDEVPVFLCPPAGIEHAEETTPFGSLYRGNALPMAILRQKIRMRRWKVDCCRLHFRGVKPESNPLYTPYLLTAAR